MADLIAGLSIIEAFHRFIPALLILILIYALLQYTKALGDNKFVHALISLALALIFLFNAPASKTITMMAPWFVVLFFFIIFVIMGFKAMGMSDASILSGISNNTVIAWWVIILSIVIGGLAIANSLGQGLLEAQGGENAVVQQGELVTVYDQNGNPTQVMVNAQGTTTSNYTTNLTRTLFHPTVLGFLALCMIGVFTIYFMTRAY